jgi:hypothetical protein
MTTTLQDIWTGKPAEWNQFSTLSAEQQGVSDAISKLLTGGLGKGATPYSGKMVADMPTLMSEAFNKLSGLTGKYNDIVQNSLTTMAQGTPAWGYDPAGVTNRWRQTYAIPVMETWKNTVMPLVNESFNIPGVAYAASRGRGVQDQANAFYSQNVMPSLFSAQESELNRAFQSTENAASQRLGATQVLSNLPYSEFSNTAGASQTMMGAQQPGLTAAYNEFIRTQQENNPLLSAGMSYMGTPTTAGIYSPETTGLDSQLLASMLMKAFESGELGQFGWENLIKRFTDVSSQISGSLAEAA